MSTFANMQTHFDGQVGAFAYLLFILSLMPCAAIIRLLIQSQAANWAIFTTMWLSMAFMISSLYYQPIAFAAHQGPEWQVAFLYHGGGANLVGYASQGQHTGAQVNNC